MRDAPSTPNVFDADPPARDPVLLLLAGLANQGLVTLGITLNVNGLIVTGITASMQDYFAGLQEEARNAGADVGVTLFGSVLSAYEEHAARDKFTDFLHLRDARILRGDGYYLTNRGVWWRGRIDSIDGFFLGQVGAK